MEGVHKIGIESYERLMVYRYVLMEIFDGFLTWTSSKDSRKGSSEKNIRSNFVALFILKYKMEHFKPNYINLVPWVFEIRYTQFM